MSVIAITGSVSGIGASTRQRLEAAGHQTIGIDLRGADLAADLSSAAGRDAAIAALLERCGGRLDGLVLCAGLGPQVSDATQIVEVNYYGVVALLDALLPALQRGSSPAAVVVSSVASTQMVWDKNPLGSGLEAGDMQRWHAALAAAADRAGHLAYAGSKNAVIVAVRRRVLAWAQAGVRLNSVAPGAVETPLLQAGMADPRYGKAIAEFLGPMGRRARPEEIAVAIAFLLGPDASYVHGAQLNIDGGVDAQARPTSF
jgi:NAD(P)-dependent dehydrogenase (short-subunit alcohol dehydrogenase family)